MSKRQLSKWISVALFLFLFPQLSWADPKTATAVFAGGCFWSMQHDFDKLDGVMETTVGYTGGNLPNPSYDQVSGGDTGHYEAIKVVYNPNKITYQKLLDYYWHDIDPTDATGQFCDNGNEYHSVIFYNSPAQKKIAEASKDNLMKTQGFSKIYTLILPAKPFYPAEDYHQKYAEKNPVAYDSYRSGCRRDATLKEVWGGK